MADEDQTSGIRQDLGPADLADEYLKACGYVTSDGLGLRRYRGEWLLYDGRIFKPIKTEELEADIMRFLRGTCLRAKLKKTFVNEIVHQLVSICLMPSHVELPARQRGATWITETGAVTFENGVISLSSPLGGPELVPHSPMLISRVCLPYQFDPLAGCPRWWAFLEQILPEEGDRQLLQEIFGYCLTYDRSQQKFFMFEGTGGNGKGVVTNLLRRLLGPENVSTLPLSRFGGTHDLIVTLGKLVNIMSELKISDKIAEDQLKQFTGNDAMYFDPKYREPFCATPTAKIILSTNERPQFSDKSDGLWRRLIVLPFPVTIQEEDRNIHLEEELATELPGIFNWALQGLYSLRGHGRFHEPQGSVETRESFRRESNPVVLFLERDNYVAHPGGMVIAQDMYRDFEQFCRDHGYKPFNEGNFSKEVFRVFKGVAKPRRYVEGSKRHVYLNITTSPKGLTSAFLDQTSPAPQGAEEILLAPKGPREDQADQVFSKCY